MSERDSEAALGHLARSALFGALAEPDLKAIVGLMRPQTFSANQLIFSRGDKGNGVYLVMTGRVRLSILTAEGRELSLNHAAEGTLFGEIAALDDGERSADATAITPVRALVLPQAAITGAIEGNPRVARAVIRFLCALLRHNAENLEAIALHAIEVRLARYLLSVLEKQGASGKTSAPLSLGISQTEIGLLIGASRPKVNAAFAALEDQGAMRKKGAEIICDLDALRACAGYEE